MENIDIKKTPPQKSKPALKYRAKNIFNIAVGISPKNNYLKVFWISLLVSALIFLPYIIYEGGYFLYFGDFNVQQIPFYVSAHEAVQNGELGWSWITDLGSSFIGSYSFYLLTSPFFWITLLFPTSAVPFLLAPLLMLKFACAGVTSFAFIKRFTKKEEFAIIGALMYAFCGFNLFNVFFNHFHEAIIIFPLMLVALEELVVNDRKGVFALAVFASAFINYYFFFGQVFFVIIYFMIKLLCDDYKIPMQKFAQIAFEAVLGLLLAGVILLPSILAILSNNRLSSFLTGMNLLMYGEEQRYGLIIQSMFFPPDIPARPNFFPDSNAKWSSVSLYLPLFSLTGVIVFFKNRGKHWIKTLLIVSFVMAIIPVANSLFSAFNSSYYARWFYMPVLIMCVASCISLEDEKVDYSYGVKISALFVAGFSMIGVVPTVKDGVKEYFKFPPFPDRFWAYVAIAVISLVIVSILIKIPRTNKVFTSGSIILTCVITLCYSWLVIGTGKQHSDKSELIIDQGINGAENLTLPQDSFYRIDTFDTIDNIHMYWDMPNLQTFHSVVSTSIMEFYQSFDMKRSVASRPNEDYFSVRGLTSVKYQIAETTKKPEEVVPGFEFNSQQNGFDVYENKYFIPMGFTYDYYVDEATFNEYKKDLRDDLMLQAMYISDEDKEKLTGILEPIKSEDILNFDTDINHYYSTCEDRASVSGYSFEYDSYSFTSKIKLDKAEAVFFSVPYDKGWSATVNGEPVSIMKANTGFMAVVAPSGDNEIVFSYQTEGLKQGALISLGALAVLIGYIAYFRKRKKIK